MTKVKDWLDNLTVKEQWKAYYSWVEEREKNNPDEEWSILKKQGLTRVKDFEFWKEFEHHFVNGQCEVDCGNVKHDDKTCGCQVYNEKLRKKINEDFLVRIEF